MNIICRSWHQVFGVQHGRSLSFYKDPKNKLKEITFNNEHPLNLSQASVELAADYTKKKHVFRLK